MDEIDKLIDELLKHKAADVVTRLKEKAKSAIYQPIFNDGHSVATGAHTSAAEKLQGQLDTALREKKELEDRLKTATSGSTDVDKINKEWQKKIDDKDREIQNLVTQQKAEKVNGKHESARSKVLALVNARITDPDLAEAKVAKEFKRVQVDETNLSVRVLQPGQSIPFAGDEEAQLKALAEEIVGGVKPEFVRSEVASGSGRDASTGGTGANLKGKAFYDAIREQASKPKGAVAVGDGKTVVNPQDALDARLGVRRS